MLDNAKAQCKPQEIKIVMEDWSAKVGKERDYKIFGLNSGKNS